MIKINQSEMHTFGLKVWEGTIEKAVPPHRHNELELNLIERGFMTYILAGQQVTVNMGEIAVFWAALPHQVIDHAEVTSVHWGTIPLQYVLQWEMPQTFLLAVLSGTLFHFKSRTIMPYDVPFFQQWHRDILDGDTGMALIEIRAMMHRFSALYEKLDQHSRASTVKSSLTENKANLMAEYMSKNFDQPISVTDIAAHVALHPNYAMTIFKQEFGVTLVEYLTQQRIAYAQQLLITTNASVTEIALQSGFQTLSYFYTAFKKLCGTPPGKYRKSLLRQ